MTLSINYILAWSPLTQVLSIFLAFILYFIYKFVLLPLIRMQHYRKQGIDCAYFPLIGEYRENVKAGKEKGDSEYPCKNKAKTNPQRITCSNFGSDVSLVLHDVSLIKEFYLHTENYIKDPMFLMFYQSLLGKGLITSEGAQWKRQRKILSNAFHFEFLKSVVPQIQKIAHEKLYNLRNKCLTKANIMDEFQKITGEVIGKIFFGEQLDNYWFDSRPLTIALADLIIELAKLGSAPERFILGARVMLKGIFPKHRRVMKNVSSFRQVCNEIVQERKKLKANQVKRQGEKDMLDLLLEYEGEEGKISDEEIIDQFVSFFLAGMDTTGHLANIAVYLLDKYPEHRAKVIGEIKDYYSLEQAATIEDLNKLEFMTAFLKETLRTMTPVPGIFPRKAIKDHNLKDIRIRKGDMVGVNFFYNHYSPENFENADKFEPERWTTKERGIESFVFLPFSAGPRNCIGQHLAMIEAKVILAEFLTMYEFKLQENYELKMGAKFMYEPMECILLDLAPKYH